MIIAEIVFWSAGMLFLYVFVGYPVLVWNLGRIVPKGRVGDGTYHPTVTLIISAYNEAPVIREKILNSLALVYPWNKLDILVISDGSTDGTDAIVQEYEVEGITLKRMITRGGKTVGLNTVVPHVDSEVIVFSDANAMYHPNAIEKLVRNFQDPHIGCVTGDSVYVNLEESRVGKSEETYWDYDRFLKVQETKIGSMVGSDGAIFAIRTHVYTSLEPDDINDFVLPLRIVEQGYRCVFEPEAVCKESATIYFEEEFRRKVRVVNRSWTGFWKVSRLLNPFRYGWFSMQMVSHKLLRWLTPVFMIAMFVASVPLAYQNLFYAMLLSGQVVVYALCSVGMILEIQRKHSRWLSFPAYFLMVNVASFFGVSKALCGERIIVWNPERSHAVQIPRKMENVVLRLGFILLLGLYVVAISLWPQRMFWFGLAMIFYTYLGYPLLLMLCVAFRKQEWKQSEAYQPSVTLLIVAHNEEDIIEAKILNSFALEYPHDKFTVVVASDGSTDHTNSILAKYQHQGVHAHYEDTRMGKVSVMNRVIPTLDSEIIVVSDANVLYQKDAILKLMRNFSDTAVGVVSGEVTLINEKTGFAKPEKLYYQYEWYLKRLESSLHSQIGADGAMYAFRKTFFSSIPNRTVVDDLVLAMNIALAGYRVVSDREARGFETSPNSLYDEFQRHIRITAGGIQSFLACEGLPSFKRPGLLLQYLSHKLLRWLTGLLMIGVFVSNCLILDSLVYQVLFVCQIVFYVVALMGWLDIALITFSFPFYVCTLNAACSLGVVKGILNLQSPKWEKMGRATMGNVDVLAP